jgi:hypothetical protein
MRVGNAAGAARSLLIGASYFVPIMLSGSIAILFVILLFNLLFLSRAPFRAFRRGIARLARFLSDVNPSTTPITRLSPREDKKIAMSKLPGSD